MNEHSFEAAIAQWLTAEAPRTEPESLLDGVLAVSARSRPLPAWRALLSVPVMRTQSVVLVGSPTWRLAPIVLALLLGALIIGAAVVASRLALNAADLVRQSQAAHENPPPFTMIITAFDLPGDNSYPGCHDTPDPEPIRYLYFYDGSDGFRFECLRPGMERGRDFQVRSGETYGEFFGTTWSATSDPATFIRRPGEVFDLNWRAYPDRAEELDRDARLTNGLVDCTAWTLGSRDVVAGRPAQEVSCGADSYWIDEATDLVVRLQIGDLLVSEAVSLQAGTIPPAELFAVAPPVDVRRTLVVGQVPPDWTLPTYGSSGQAPAEFSSATLKGRPAIVLFHHAEACPLLGCLDVRDFSDATAAYRDRLGALVLGQGSYSDDTIDYLLSRGVTLVSDTNEAVPSWYAPEGTLAFLDADGRVVELTLHRSARSLAQAVGAFLAGDPVPPPPVGDGVFATGEPVPALVGERMTRDSDGRLVAVGPVAQVLPGGKPSVVLSAQSVWRNRPAENAELLRLLVELARAKTALGDEADVVVIAWPDFVTGDWRASFLEIWEGLLDQAGAEVGDALGQLVLVDGVSAPPQAEYPFGQGWRVLGVDAGNRGDLDTVMVLVDAEGRVTNILQPPLPGADELVALVRALEAP